MHQPSVASSRFLHLQLAPKTGGGWTDCVWLTYMSDLDKKTYLELVLNGAAQFAAQFGVENVRRAAADPGSLDAALHPFVTGILARADHLEDVLKVSGRTDPDPKVWRDAVNWSEVLFRAAYLMVLEDLKEQALRMCAEGETILTAPPVDKEMASNADHSTGSGGCSTS